MSVVSGKREEGELKVIISSGKLCDHTLQITANEKYFPKKYRWNITKRIIDAALDIDDHIIYANSVYVRQGDGSLQRRREHQLKALELTYVLLNNIDRAYRRLDLNSNKVQYWTGLVIEVQKLLRGWYKRDKERYEKYNG